MSRVYFTVISKKISFENKNTFVTFMAHHKTYIMALFLNFTLFCVIFTP